MTIISILFACLALFAFIRAIDRAERSLMIQSIAFYGVSVFALIAAAQLVALAYA